MNTWSSLSHEIATAVEQAAPSIVQVHGRRRVAAGLVFADNSIVTPASVDDDTVAVHAGSGDAREGVVLGRIGHLGLTIIRVDGLGLRPLTPGDEPRPGQIAVAIGRTWSPPAATRSSASSAFSRRRMAP
jgi:hypothetical protein